MYPTMLNRLTSRLTMFNKKKGKVMTTTTAARKANDNEEDDLPLDSGLQGDIQYLESLPEPRIFKRGKPRQFIIPTSKTGARVFCKVHGIDSYFVFIGSEEAKNLVEKTKGIGLQYMKPFDMREIALILTDLADTIEGKVKAY